MESQLVLISDLQLILVPLSIVVMVLVSWYFMKWTRLVAAGPGGKKLKKLQQLLPPGPKPWPMFGSLFLMDPQEAAHLTFGRLAEKYGPLMLMWMGSSPTLLISNAAMAESFFKNHDQTFAHRPYMLAGKHLGFQFSNVVFSSYGPYYSRLRKIYTLELLSPKRVSLSQGLRQIEVHLLLQSVLKDSLDLQSCSAAGMSGNVSVINMSSKLQTMGIDNLVRMIFARPNSSKSTAASLELITSEERDELKAVVKRAVELAGMFYIGDFIPIFQFLDFQGIETQMKELSQSMRRIAMHLIEKQRRQLLQGGIGSTEIHGSSASKLNIVEVLLAQDGDDKLSDDAMTAVIFDFIIAGSDTTSVSTEWTLAELLNHPQDLQRAQKELDTVVGRERLVEEADIVKLPFLQAIVKESFRLHPPAPLGIPHACKEACRLGGYDIPANTTAMINIWAIGRDPSHWENPHLFSPQRFLDDNSSASKNVTMFGKDFQLLPFLTGRRQCPGAQLGLAVVQLAVASLLHSFDWSLPSSASDSTTTHHHQPLLSMKEKPGLVTPRAADLNLIVTPRLPISVYMID